MHRRRLLGILTAALLGASSLLAPAAVAATGPGATAVEVGDDVVVGESTEGEATGAEVAGQKVASTEGDGSGHLVSTRDAGVDEDIVEVTVMATEVDGDESSVDTLTVAAGGDEGVRVTALSSERDGTGASSTGLSGSAAGRSGTLLHAAAEGTTGRTVVGELDGEEHGTNEQTDERLCTGELPAVIKAELFCAEGGEQGGAAVVLDGAALEELSARTGLSIGVLRANGVGTPTITPDSPRPEGDPLPPLRTASFDPVDPRTPAAAPAPDAPLAAPVDPSGSLPTTGVDGLALAALAMALLAGGSTLLAARD